MHTLLPSHPTLPQVLPQLPGLAMTVISLLFLGLPGVSHVGV